MSCRSAHSKSLAVLLAQPVEFDFILGSHQGNMLFKKNNSPLEQHTGIIMPCVLSEPCIPVETVQTKRSMSGSSFKSLSQTLWQVPGAQP